MIKLLFGSALALGLASVVWMGSVFMGADTAALTITAIIGGVYCIGVVELVRYRAATAGLSAALSGATDALHSLDSFIEKLDETLRAPVKLRIEGDRVGLPVPVLTPYLIGLLVMLGLLGTFVGMVDTLRGAVTALEGTTELAAVRAGLAAPIKGLGLAFGTSVAGVATSAMLGLMSTLSKRDRVLEIRRLDAMTATVFRSFSLVHGQRETFSALQTQAQALPEVAMKLTQMAEAMTVLGHEIKQAQSTFHSEMSNQYQGLANSLNQSLQASVQETGKLAAGAVTPIVERSIGQIEASLREVEAQRRSDEVSHFETLRSFHTETNQKMEALWLTSHERQHTTAKALTQSLETTVAEIQGALTRSTEGIFEGLGSLSEKLTEQQARADAQRLDTWSRSLETRSQEQRDELTSITNKLSNHLVELSSAQVTHSDALHRGLAELTQEWKEQLRGLQAETVEGKRELVSEFKSAVERLYHEATAAEGERLGTVERLLQESEQLLRARVDSESKWSEQHREQLGLITDAISGQLAALRDEESRRGEQAVTSLERLEETFATQVARLGQELEAPLREMIQVASEAPKAASEVIVELRAEVSKGISRDNQLLEERQRLMEDLDSLSSSLALASTEQREAIEGLVDASREMLGDVGRQFTDYVGSEVSRVSDVAESFAGSAIEMASMTDAFNTAVQLFNDTNEKMMESLARIEESLETASSRSDEQLGYYVAQAREIIDHSMLSQKEIFEELRQLRRDDDIDLEAN